MSVEYTASIIAGHTVSAEEIAKLDSETYEQLVDGGYLHIIDRWHDDSDYIFGKVLVSLDCNDCTFVNTADYALPEEEYRHLTLLWNFTFKRPLPSLNHYLVGMCE